MADARVLDSLPALMRERADELEPFSAPAAAAYRQAATMVETALRDADGEPLKLSDAARISGYSADHLSRLVLQGKLRNVGRKHAPLVLRGELPVKPRAAAPPLRMAAGGESDVPVDLDTLARARRARGRR